MLSWKVNAVPMKKTILNLFALLLLFSCSKKEKYYGTWSQYFANSRAIKITSDSISINYDDTQWTTYPVSITNNSLTFLNHTFETSFSGDSLLFENSPYLKYTPTPILEIKFPELTTASIHEPNPEERLIFIRFGKVPNSDEYRLQLNDRYAEFEEIIDYFYTGHHSSHEIYRFVLICDKNAKMKDLEPLFQQMIKINAVKFYTVNHTEYEVIDNEIKQKHKLQKHQITPIHTVTFPQQVNESIVLTKHTYIDNSSFLKDFESKKTSYLSLVNNDFYIGKKKYKPELFAKKVDSINNNNFQLVTMFDSNSNFKQYALFNTLINNQSKNSEVKNIQNLYIPNFLSLDMPSRDNINFLYENIKQQLPEAYFENHDN